MKFLVQFCIFSISWHEGIYESFINQFVVVLQKIAGDTGKKKIQCIANFSSPWFSVLTTCYMQSFSLSARLVSWTSLLTTMLSGTKLEVGKLRISLAVVNLFKNCYHIFNSWKVSCLLLVAEVAFALKFWKQVKNLFGQVLLQNKYCWKNSSLRMLVLVSLLFVTVTKLLVCWNIIVQRTINIALALVSLSVDENFILTFHTHLLTAAI